jgi:hypothetical protein
VLVKNICILHYLHSSFQFHSYSNQITAATLEQHHSNIIMAILSSTIRRSHVMRRLLLDKSSNGFLTRQQQQQQYALAYRRGLHATSAVYGDALDMADTFSRRHGKLVISYCADMILRMM